MDPSKIPKVKNVQDIKTHFFISLAHKLFIFPFINPANDEENTIEVVTYPK